MTGFDDHFIAFLGRREPLNPGSVRIVRDLCKAVLSHHSCLSLKDYSEEDINALRSVAGDACADTPLILDGGVLYLHRHFHQESSVAAMILARNRAADSNLELVHSYLEEHYPRSKEPDLQKLALFQAATRQLTIITGGPGTGKTTVVARVIDLLLKGNPGLQVRLAAPTGKAAMRLSEAVKVQPAVTLHRLLGMRSNGRSWRHGRDNPVPADVLVVDEASMIDLEMMERLLAALSDHTRLILLGDPRQLPSVDTGNVLADLCALGPEYTPGFCRLAATVMHVTPTRWPSGLANAICRLKKSHRFGDDSEIGRFAAGIKAGTARADTSRNGAIKAYDISALTPNPGPKLLDHWDSYLALLDARVPARQLLAAFGSCRVLCSHRNGFPGVNTLNQAIEAELERRGLKQPGDTYYEGQPLLITRNDYNLRLYNGDIGICVRRQSGEDRPPGEGWLIAFPNAQGDMQHYLPSRLPDHETCFAMTVHKSQGSEFEHVIIVLGEGISDNIDELVTRELIYTAVTRTKKTLTLYCSTSCWDVAMSRPLARASGMAGYLASSKPQEG